MKNPKDINIEDYSYELPEDRIAKFPLAQRDESKLLVYNQGNISEDVFKNISTHLKGGMLMVMNNTKVIQARLMFKKETGTHIEVFCLNPHTPNDYALAFVATKHCAWECMVGNAKRWKNGQTLSMPLTVNGKPVTLKADRHGENCRTMVIDFSWDEEDVNWADILDACGVLPIPPYLKRETQESDKTTYQTIYSKIKGSVAAPTAGLHFTEKEFGELAEMGIERDEVTLHVGAGTFQPVKSETLNDHEMHTEVVSINRSTIEHILKYKGNIIAVGTTSVRTLESLYYFGAMLHENMDLHADELKVGQWMPYEAGYTIDATTALESVIAYLDRHGLDALKGSTQIIIAPGYEFKIVKAMVTNFHQPENTLMLLVAAFVGDDWKKIYEYALTHNFRFLSYGDSSLLLPRGV
ncbi:MAG: S-adenosylmethionine:tRNA ribosyltransferase-isomerase [Paludibacteraceae bacterium]|nr:S-adenosylmethionine:tRNA ribosyltransferase-isomerase [Paludibacteraceae bacterium]